MEYDSKHLFVVTRGVDKNICTIGLGAPGVNSIWVDGWEGLHWHWQHWLRTEKIWSSHLHACMHALYGMRSSEEYYFLYLFILFRFGKSRVYLLSSFFLPSFFLPSLYTCCDVSDGGKEGRGCT